MKLKSKQPKTTVTSEHVNAFKYFKPQFTLQNWNKYIMQVSYIPFARKLFKNKQIYLIQFNTFSCVEHGCRFSIEWCNSSPGHMSNLHFWRRKIGDFKLISVLYEAEMIQSTGMRMLFDI